MPRVHVGTSGYVYDHWSGALYPETLPRSAWFERYASLFSTVEINNTYYRLPSEKAVARWKAAAPEGFRYAFKAHRYITHYRRLARPEEPLGKFFRPLEPLREQTAAILFQLPERVPRDDARLRAFLRALPHGWRHVFEFRDPSWFAPEVLDLLGEHGAAFCIHDWPASRPVPVEATSSLVYVRFHGVEEPYQGRYGPRRLAPWVDRIRRWRQGRRDVLVFFNNDERAYAAQDAAWLAARVERRDVPSPRATPGEVAPRRSRSP